MGKWFRCSVFAFLLSLIVVFPCTAVSLSTADTIDLNTTVDTNDIIAQETKSDWYSDWALSILGGTDDTAAIGVGKVFAESHTEFGLSVLAKDEGGNTRSAFGPYIAYQSAVPGIDEEDAMSFLGGAVHIDEESARPLFRGFAGLLLTPQSQVSPVVLYNYNYHLPESDVLGGIDRSEVFAGLRIRF